MRALPHIITVCDGFQTVKEEVAVDDEPEKSADDDDEEGKVEDDKEEKKTKEVEKTVWDWVLVNDNKPLWTRK